jgi:hypothetical protein
MFNISLAWAFLISFHFSIGGKFLSIIMPLNALKTLPVYQQNIAIIFANYWLPAILIYILFKLISTRNILQPNTGIQILLGSANIVLVIYACMKVFASSIQGGGASFALASVSSYIVTPCKIALYGGMLWLIIRSLILKLNSNNSPSELVKQPVLKSVSSIFAITMLLPPICFFAWFYMSNFEQINVAQKKRNLLSSRFEQLCNSVEIEINARVDKPKGVHFHGITPYYIGLLNELDFVEVSSDYNSRIQKITKIDGQPALLNGKVQDVNKETISKPSANYGVTTRFTKNESDKTLGIISKETIIMDRTSNKVLTSFPTFSRKTEKRYTSEYCPGGYGFEVKMVKYVLGITDELKTEGVNIKMPPK